MKVLKKDSKLEPFNVDKLISAVSRAYLSKGREVDLEVIDELHALTSYYSSSYDTVSVDTLHDDVSKILMDLAPYDVAVSYILYREKHREARYIRDRLDYMEKYSSSTENAASSSETDANANVSMKNVVTLEAENPKVQNRIIQRQRMKDKLNEMYPDLAKRYEEDINHHIIYIHDEASSAVPKNYCEAISMYPMLIDKGVGGMDGVTPKPANWLDSFCGQFNNLVFLLSAQCKGAVAFGEFFNFLDYFCVKEFGENYHNKEELPYTTNYVKHKMTIGDKIEAAFQTIVYYVNQPAQNRGWQSPFTNISYYDRYYWKALFEDFCFPDGTKPEWERVSYLQKKFMKWFNKERTKAMLTFPVETMALLTDDKGNYLDEEYKDFTAEMHSKGHSFFVYISDNPDSLSSCCRLKNVISTNEFSFTNGLSGVRTGSCNVITLNLSRIIQDWYKENYVNYTEDGKACCLKNDKFDYKESLKEYITGILERVYCYHKAYKSILYDWEKRGMFTACNEGYISMKDLFCTIGINGLNEAARFLGMEVNYNDEYRDFCRLIIGTISEANKANTCKEFKFNQEFVPAESLSSKNYNFDKEGGYWVPSDTKIYNSYFYNAWDPDTSVLEKFKLHGREFTELLDGGKIVQCHLVIAI